MSLTYRPFADSGEVDDLSEELHRNIPDGERVVFGLAGFASIAFAARLKGFPQWVFLAIGAFLVRRGWRGYSACYEHLAIDPRHRRQAEFPASESSNSPSPDSLAATPAG